jgi:hypothetical protein
MDTLVVALGPVFAAGFAVQQLLEILTSILNLDTKPAFEKYKKTILGVVSLAVGLGIAYSVPTLRVLSPLKVEAPGVDFFVTALVLSAGTEGINSIMKFLKYTKEDKKNSAASKDPSNAGAAAASVAALVPPGIAGQTALDKINLK